MRASMCSNRFGRHMQIVFGELLAFDFFSLVEGAFVCSRSFYLFLNEKLFVMRYKGYIETKLSRRGNPWIFLVMWLLSINKPTTHRSLGAFYIYIFFYYLLYFYFIIYIPITIVFTGLFSWYFKIVWPQVCFRFLTRAVSWKCRRKCHRSIKEKGTVTKANLGLWGLGNFSHTIFVQRKCPTYLSLYQ